MTPVLVKAMAEKVLEFRRGALRPARRRSFSIGMAGSMMPLLLALLLRRREKRRHHKLVKRLVLENAVLREELASASLERDARDSAWHKIYRQRDAGVFLAMTSLDPDSFDLLLEEFAKHYVVKSSSHLCGRPLTLLDEHAALACLLYFYTNPKKAPKSTSELFCTSPSTMSATIAKAEVALAETLKNVQEARVVFPSKDTQREWSRLTKEKKPMIDGVFANMDRKCLRVKNPSERELFDAQRYGRSIPIRRFISLMRCFPPGWPNCDVVTGLVVIGVDGTLCWAQHNCPVWLVEDRIGSKFEDYLLKDSVLADGCCVAADSAYPLSIELEGRIKMPLRQVDLHMYDPSLHAVLLNFSDAMTTLRESTDWGMDAVLKVYPVLEDELPYNPHVRGRRIMNILQLYNVRLRRTGISPVRSHFFTS
jgi:hypothetical protein